MIPARLLPMLRGVTPDLLLAGTVTVATPSYVFTAAARTGTHAASARTITHTAAARSTIHTPDNANRMNQ